MGCGQSSDESQDKKKNNNDDDLQAVGPSDGGNSKRPTGEDGPKTATQGTKDKVNNGVDDALYEETHGDGSDARRGNPLLPSGQGVEFENHADKALVNTGGRKREDEVSGDGFVCFGGGTGAPECVVDDDEDTQDPGAGPKVAKGTKMRRIGVSSEPILPDDAENFVPRVIEKDEATRKKLRDVTSKNYLFGSLEPEELDTVIDAMECETFQVGQDILQQDHDSTEKFYFIMMGKVDILKSEVEADNGRVTSFTAGQTFGELELMYLAPCAATVRCVESLECYSIDRDTYRNIVMMVSIRKRRLYKELLAAVPFLAEMSDYQAMTLADALSPVTFQPGDHLLTFGIESEWMYIIVSGMIKVIGRDKDDETKQVDVCELGSGTTVGELEFLNCHRAVADVVCHPDGPVKCCRLHRQHFELCMGPVRNFLQKNSESTTYDYYHNVFGSNEAAGAGGEGRAFGSFKFGETSEGDDHVGAGFTAFGGSERSPQQTSLGEEGGTDDSPRAARRNTKTRRIGVSDETQDQDDDWVPPVYAKDEAQTTMLRNTLRANPLLGAMEGADLNTLIAAMEPLSFPAGTEILTQGGDHGTHYYVITKGLADILKNGELIVTFSIGQGFGEMELMYIQPCVATVKARNDLDTWAINRQTYKKLVMKLALERRELYTELLSKIDFLEQMSDYDRHTLADALSPVESPEGTYIIKRGEQNDWMHIIVDGKVEVFGVDEESDSNARKHICFLERGACVGELEFLNQHRAVADCVAVSTLRTVRLHRDHFELCMGPIVDVLRKTVRQDKYEYYQSQLDDLRHAKIAGRGGSNEGDGGGVLTKSASDVHLLNRQRGRRTRAKAISADVMLDGEDADYIPPSYPKTEEELDVLQKIIRKAPLFAAMPLEDRQVVIAALQPFKLPADAIVVSQGELPDEAYWYVIALGSVEQRVLDSGESTGFSTVASYTHGHAFGEIDLMYSTPSNFTTLVTSPSGLEGFRLDRRSYRKIVMKLSADRRTLYKELLSGVAFLSELTDAQQDSLADALSPTHFSPGDYLIKQGSMQEWMYIIADGVVEVFSAEQERICDLRRGEMVGELEFLHQHAAVADCIASTHVSACRLHRDHFELCMGPVSGYIENTLKNPKYSFYVNQGKK